MIEYQAAALPTTGQVLGMALDMERQRDILGAGRANELAAMEHGNMVDTDAIHGDMAQEQKTVQKKGADTDTYASPPSSRLPLVYV
jgi:hypothetical protein